MLCIAPVRAYEDLLCECFAEAKWVVFTVENSVTLGRSWDLVSRVTSTLIGARSACYLIYRLSY